MHLGAFVIVFVLFTTVTAREAKETVTNEENENDSSEILLRKIYSYVQLSPRQAGYGLIKFEDQSNQELNQNTQNLNQNKYGFFQSEAASNRPFVFEDQSINQIHDYGGMTGNINLSEPQLQTEENNGQFGQNPQKKKRKRRKRKPRGQQFTQYQGYPGFPAAQEHYPPAVPSGYPGPFMYRPVHRTPQTTWSSVVETLTSLTINDDYQCLPMLVCQAAARGVFGNSSLAQFPSVNALVSAYGSLSSSPIAVFGRAAILGMTARDDPASCSSQYPRCPSDPQELIYYLNNYKGGFFRSFSSPGFLTPQGQFPPGHQYPNAANDLLAHLAPQLQNTDNYGLYRPNYQYMGQNQQNYNYGFQGRNTYSEHTHDIHNQKDQKARTDDDFDGHNDEDYNRRLKKAGNNKITFYEGNSIENKNRRMLFDGDSKRSRRSAYNEIGKPEGQTSQSQTLPLQIQANRQYANQWHQSNPFQSAQQVPLETHYGQGEDDIMLNLTSNRWYLPNSNDTKGAMRTSEPVVSLKELMQMLEVIASKDDKHCMAQLVCEVAIKNKAKIPVELLTNDTLGQLPLLSPTYGAAMKYGFEHIGKDNESCAYHYPDCPQDKRHFFYYMKENRGGIDKFLGADNWMSLIGTILDDVRNEKPEAPVLSQYKTPLRLKMEAQSQNYGSYQQNYGSVNNYQNYLPYPNGQNSNYQPRYRYNNKLNYGKSFQQPVPYNYQKLSPYFKYNNYQKNYNLYRQSRRFNIENKKDLNGNKQIQKRIQNRIQNLKSEIFAEDVENDNDKQDRNVKWRFPERSHNVIDKVKHGSHLKFPLSETNKIEDATIETNNFIFPGAQSNRQYFLATAFNQHKSEVRPGRHDNVYFTKTTNKRDHRQLGDDGYEVVYIVRGNGDPYHPEIVRLRPGEKVLRR